MANGIAFDTLVTLLRNAGATAIYAKRLAANDNSKNQIYLGPNFTAINLLPVSDVTADPQNPQIFKAPLDFQWLRENGTTTSPSETQLILYPQYPEVRMGGLLKGAQDPPSDVIATREEGRILFLGVAGRRVLAFVVRRDSVAAREFEDRAATLRTYGVFYEIPAQHQDPRDILVDRLRDVARRGWINSQRLLADGSIVDCLSTNCGGYTLESLLGILPSGSAEPDFMGWELKTHSVTNPDRIDSASPVTLMTPEPTGGLYREQGAEAFLRSYGEQDRAGRDRINFTGRHLQCVRSTKTGLHLVLEGYDPARGTITDATGGIALRDRDNNLAAIWHFTGLMAHWNRKHASAAYMACCKRTNPRQQYHYTRHLRLGEGTDFELLLKAIHERRVYYDPGIKLEGAATATPSVKKRNQFRIASRHIDTLYRRTQRIDLLA